MSGNLLGPAFGPVLGGLLLQFGGWRSIFYFTFAWAAMVIAAVVLILPGNWSKCL